MNNPEGRGIGTMKGGSSSQLSVKIDNEANNAERSITTGPVARFGFRFTGFSDFV